MATTTTTTTGTTGTTGTTATGGNISVVVRVRPLMPHEAGSAPASSEPAATARRQSFLADVTGDAAHTQARIVSVLDQHVLVFDPLDPNAADEPRYALRSGGPRRTRSKQVRYAFDCVLGESASQSDVFDSSSRPLIASVLDGYNATVFAYGATGCGKTHTITGTPADPGLISRTVQELFARLADLEARGDRLVEATISYLEVYNETIRDLLVPGQPLDLREDADRVVVAGLSEHSPSDLAQVMALLLRGNENRIKAPTLANAASSRSHAVLQIHIRHRDRSPAGTTLVKASTLSIIDLAGSERASVTKNKGERLIEGANINRSLLALGNCINALCSDRPSHVPYRDSKLTRLLKFSLSGNCKVVMIANISPATIHYEETHNTLKYANRAKNIKTKLAQNTVEVVAHIGQYPKIIEALRAEIMLLRSKAGQSSMHDQDAGMLLGLETSGDGADDTVFARLLAKAGGIIEKFEASHTSIIGYQSQMSSNEHMVRLFKSLLISLSQLASSAPSSSTLSPQQQHVQTMAARFISRIADRIDSLHAANAALWHNADEARIAAEHHVAALERHKSNPRLHSPLLRERLALDISSSMMQVQSRLVDCQRTTAETAHLALSDLVLRLMKANTDMVAAAVRDGGSGDALRHLEDFLVNEFPEPRAGSDAAVGAIGADGQHAAASSGSSGGKVHAMDTGEGVSADEDASKDTAAGIEIIEYDSCSEETDSVCDRSFSIAGWQDDERDDDAAFDVGVSMAVDALFKPGGAGSVLAGLGDMDQDMLAMETHERQRKRALAESSCDADDDRGDRGLTHAATRSRKAQPRAAHDDAADAAAMREDQTPMRPRAKLMTSVSGASFSSTGATASSVASSIKTPQPLSVVRAQTRRIHMSETQLDQEATPVARKKRHAGALREQHASGLGRHGGDDMACDEGGPAADGDVAATPRTVRVERDSGHVRQGDDEDDELDSELDGERHHGHHVSKHDGPGGPLRMTPIRRDHRRRMRQSLIPISRPVAPRLVADTTTAMPPSSVQAPPPTNASAAAATLVTRAFGGPSSASATEIPARTNKENSAPASAGRTSMTLRKRQASGDSGATASATATATASAGSRLASLRANTATAANIHGK